MKLPPLFYTCLFLGMGILSTLWLGGNRVPVVFIISLVGFWLYEKQAKTILVILLAVIFCFGCWRVTLVTNKLRLMESQWKNDFGQRITFSGTVADVSVSPDLNEKIVVDKITLTTERGETQRQGKIIISKVTLIHYEYGAAIAGECNLKEPVGSDGFDYKTYLYQQGIFAICDFPELNQIKAENKHNLLTQLYKVKTIIENKINRYFPEPQGALLNGILLGIKSNFTPDFSKALQQGGLMHIVVVSGTNISIILMLLLRLAPALGRQKTIGLSLVVIIYYTLMVGSNPPAVRALVMGGLVLVASLLGRKSVTLLVLFFSAALMTLFDPLLVNSLSFQLSFFATLGILLFTSIFDGCFGFFPRPIRESLNVTFSAQVLILPLLVRSFGFVSLVSPLTNFLILPLVVPITVLGIIFIVLSFIFPFILPPIAFLLRLLLDYFVTVVNFFGGLKFASAPVDQQFFRFSILYYILSVGLYFIVTRLKKRKLATDETA